MSLCQFEQELLQAMAGKRPAFPWGAAVGAALGFLKGSGYVEVRDGVYALTEKGRAEVDRVDLHTP